MLSPIVQVFLWLALLGLAPATARANEDGSSTVSTAEREIRALIDAQTRELAQNFPGRIEITVGALNNPRLAACAKIEPFVPAGARLWGRSQIGLRCREGANWQVFLPVEVRIHAQAIVASRALAAQHELADDDWQTAEVELTRDPPGALVLDPRQLAGKMTARPIASGAVLRADHLRARPVIGQGDTVKVVYLGSGFAVAADGKALAAAAEGQTIRVQMDSGRILSGTARPGRRVEVH